MWKEKEGGRFCNTEKTLCSVLHCYKIHVTPSMKFSKQDSKQVVILLLVKVKRALSLHRLCQQEHVAGNCQWLHVYKATFFVGATVMKIGTKAPNEVPKELDIALDLEYSGGCHMAIQVDLVFNKSVYLAVKLASLRGRARLELSRHPLTHWSLAFYEVQT